LGVLLSGGGRTLQNLIDRIGTGRLDAAIACVVSDKAEAQGLRRARDAGLPAVCLQDPERIWQHLRDHRCDLVCLGGYLRLLPIADDYAGRVLNIHPALLPAFGGRGMYGHHVHEAVLRSGAAESGCTVHLCTDEYDQGAVLVQRRVPVLPGDSVDTLAARVFAEECEAYPEAIGLLWRRLAAGRGRA
jgi:formyltetrahydrofolate-dependent phosphoribosylglycinamide formyltransferase